MAWGATMAQQVFAPWDWERLGEVIATADNGCSVCVADLVEKIGQKFPGMDKTAFADGIVKGQSLPFLGHDEVLRLLNEGYHGFTTMA